MMPLFLLISDARAIRVVHSYNKTGVPSEAAPC